MSFTYNPTGSPLILVDLPQGFAMCELEKRNHQKTCTIVVTNNRCPEYLEDLWDLQPAVLLTSDHLVDGSLLNAIERATQGEHYRLTPRQSTMLTPRERIILRKLARDWSNKRIAASHDVCSKTITNMVAVLCEKLDLPDRGALMLYYWGRTDLLDP
jgi:DNA-binding NarL/FixJ family response regulator